MFLFLNNIDTNSLIQNLSGIGTFVASLISLVTLFVLIRQRKDSFRPRIIFGHRLYAKCISENTDLLKTKWIYQYPTDLTEERNFCFELLNVGVGIAENVIVKESFNYKQALRFIKELDKENEFSIVIDKDSLIFRTKFDDSFMLILKNSQPRELGTFLTSKQGESNTYVFTDICLAFLSCFDYLRLKHNKPLILSLDKFPSCKYEIEYSDFEGKKYKAKYECKVSSLLLDSYTFEFIKK
jgi:hypothetical protein